MFISSIKSILLSSKTESALPDDIPFLNAHTTTLTEYDDIQTEGVS